MIEFENEPVDFFSQPVNTIRLNDDIIEVGMFTEDEQYIGQNLLTVEAVLTFNVNGGGRMLQDNIFQAGTIIEIL